MTHVFGFTGHYKPFSNFYYAPVPWGDYVTSPRYWSCNEVPYQLAKTLSAAQRVEGICAYLSEDSGNPAKIKAWGKDPARCTLQKGWKTNEGGLSIDVMRMLVGSKFTLHANLRALLLETKEGYLEETNTWGDTFFGVCRGNGQNWMGRILMQIRGELGGVGLVSNPNKAVPEPTEEDLLAALLG